MLKKVALLLATMLVMFSIMGCTQKPAIELKRYEATYLSLFDTVTTIVGYSADKESFEQTANNIKAEMEKYHQYYDIYNRYEDVTNLKTLNDTAGLAPVVVSDEIIDLLLFCKGYYSMTNGKVNVAMGKLLSIWHSYREDGIDDPFNAELPPMNRLEDAAKHMNLDDVIVDKEAGTVFFADPTLKLDVGAIAKGYAVQKVCENLEEGLLISVGGNIYATGPKDANGTPWVVGIKNPFDESGEFVHKLSITNGAIVTSGDYQRYYTVDGKEYHHIIDPVTLMPAEYFTAVTIISEDSGVADALSTALYVMPIDKGMALIEQTPNTEAVWIQHDNSLVYSSGFEAYIAD